MIKSKLGKRIALLRRERSLTQEKLAEETRYSVEFISFIERGINGPSLEGLERLAQAFSLEVFELFQFEDDE